MQGVSTVLGGRLVLQGLTISFDQGQFVALLGANGSGKTTLVRTLLGLLPPSSGQIHLFGTELSAFRDWGRIGYVPQRSGAVSGVPATVEEVVLTGRIALARRFRGYAASDRQAAVEALEAVGLANLRRSRVANLSGGQQQRVLIARALVNEPEFLVLDEPVSGIDIEHQESFADILSTLAGTGQTVLLVAHSLGVMQPLIDRTVVLSQGKVVYDGAPQAEHAGDQGHHHPPHEHAGGLRGEGGASL